MRDRHPNVGIGRRATKRLLAGTMVHRSRPVVMFKETGEIGMAPKGSWDNKTYRKPKNHLGVGWSRRLTRGVGGLRSAGCQFLLLNAMHRVRVPIPSGESFQSVTEP